MFCEDSSHYEKFRFCLSCAEKGKDVSIVFFCEKCQRPKVSKHQAHKSVVVYLSSKKFTEPLAYIRSNLRIHMNSIKIKSEENGQNNFNDVIQNLKSQKLPYLSLLDEKSDKNFFMNVDIMKWLLVIKFWEAAEKKAQSIIQKKIKSQLEEKMIEVNKDFISVIKKKQSEILQDKFSMEFKQNNLEEETQKELQNLQKQTLFQKQEIEIYNMIIKVFTSTNEQEALDMECVELIKKYPKSKLLYFCRIHLKELVPKGNEQIPQILEQINEKVDVLFKETDLYSYYMAMSEWCLLSAEELAGVDKESLVFFELKNKKHYKLRNPDAYISGLEKALSIKKKSTYYVSLGLGYFVKKNYQQALKLFNQALQLAETNKNDNLDFNKFWAEFNLNPEMDDFLLILQNLENRNLQFITNISKLLKNHKQFTQLVYCCEKLIEKQPKNLKFKVHLIKSILYYSSNLDYFQPEDEERLRRAEIMVEELKGVMKNQAYNLEKRINRLKAFHDFKNFKLQKSTEMYEKITKNSKFISASDYYNLAASLFVSYIEGNCSEENQLKKCYESISEALRLKPENIKYQRLKFFACCYMGQIDEANKILERNKLNPDSLLINQTAYSELIEFVKDNLSG